MNEKQHEPADFTKIAIDFLKKRHIEINPELESDKTVSKAQDHSKNQLPKKPSNYIDADFTNFLNTETVSNEVPIACLEDEIELYNKITVSCDISRACFWKENHSKLPRLAKLVESICCGPAATVDSKRDFSIQHV